MDGVRQLFAANGATRKTYHTGAHRMVHPEETLAWASQHMGKMGITRIANVTGLDRIGLPVVMVCRPNARSLAVFQGKGYDLPAAKASGLMEAIESYHAEHIIAPLLLASYSDMQHRRRTADVTRLPRTAESLFHPEFPLLWIEGLDLLHDEPVWVPYEMVHTNFTHPLPSGSGCFPLTSNGLASGNHLLEAISHGICEVIERDATTLWELRQPVDQDEHRLDLRSVTDPACCRVLEQFERAGVAIAVWETTSDAGIPAFLALIAEHDEDLLRPIPSSSGMGCHPSREVALLRALSEAAQSRLTAITGSRDDIAQAQYGLLRSADVLAQHRKMMQYAGSMRNFNDVPTRNAETIADDVLWELERLIAVGVRQVVVVDLTKPEFGLPVVRVIIPGLEGPAERLSGYLPGARARAVLGADR